MYKGGVSRGYDPRFIFLSVIVPDTLISSYMSLDTVETQMGGFICGKWKR